MKNACGSQRTVSRNNFSPSILCVLGHQTQVMWLGASSFTHWATSRSCPKSLNTVAETTVCDGEGAPSVGDAICWVGSWKATGLWSPRACGFGGFSTTLIFVCEQKADADCLTGIESWAEMLRRGDIPQGQLTPSQWWAIWQVSPGPVIEHGHVKHGRSQPVSQVRSSHLSSISQ